METLRCDETLLALPDDRAASPAEAPSSSDEPCGAHPAPLMLPVLVASDGAR